MFKTTTSAAVLVLALAGSAFAQGNSGNAGGGGNNSTSEGLVTVSLGDVVLQEIANDLNVEVADLVDVTQVQVPVGVAATVCGVNANVLAEQKKAGEATCDATSSSEALAQAVQKQIDG
ncbi:hypothetical protein [Aurantimonas sp. HBX-1]|uniref:hypothetical protein n=1 Tax=Aurantimonas sp. HBX-1 TaxID=2906072 RepID=UPI001F1ACC5C|nr:hypothetical protein [Aurantimonas sp. HBX-1]UIJ73375.1 hypothetical protein LXB15_06995 [Aurantimonas sp. HBX-1]